MGTHQSLPDPRGTRPPEILRPRDVPLPVRRRPQRRPSAQLRSVRRRRPLQADGGLQRPASDGMGRVRAARRERGGAQRLASDRDRSALRRQLQAPADDLGCAYDWTREINSSSPEYYKWTQWFFLLLYKRGLAYRATGAQWWCDKCRTVLANEQVINGCCWRHTDNPVTKKDLEQWYIKITDYADRLLADLDGIDWPEPIKLMQRNWIGRARARNSPSRSPVTPIRKSVSSPRGPTPSSACRSWCSRRSIRWSPRSPAPAQRATVEAYVAEARRQSEIERMSTVEGKTGVFTGAYARNVFTGKDIPIWIADYVLMGYGTGAIMAAPGEDQRDFEFATKYGLEIPRVTAPADGSTPPPIARSREHGITINSGFLNGMTDCRGDRGGRRYAEEHDIGRATISYRMRDWLISRQRYWGCPIPIVYCKTDGIVPVPEEQLPVLLPAMKDYQPSGTGRSPLANVPSSSTPPARSAAARPSARPTRSTASPARRGTSCASRRRMKTARPFESPGRRLLAAGRSLRRRRRARRDASAVRADVDQGDVRRGADRVRRAVPRACATRAWCGRPTASECRRARATSSRPTR